MLTFSSDKHMSASIIEEANSKSSNFSEIGKVKKFTEIIPKKKILLPDDSIHQEKRGTAFSYLCRIILWDILYRRG